MTWLAHLTVLEEEVQVGCVGPVFVDSLRRVVGDVDLPPFVTQGHPYQVRQGTFVVDEQHPDGRPVDAVHPGQLAQDRATGRVVVVHRRGRHRSIVAPPQATGQGS